MPAPDAKFRILTVDDSEDILALLEVVLGKEYDVKSAMDARTALRLAFEKPRPDLILLDVDMPGTNGYDLCRAIKASPALADIPIVFLTQRDDARDVVQGFQLGAIDYFTKPINPPVLAARIRAHVELINRRGVQDDLIRVRTTQLEQTRLQLIRRLGRAMEYHETSAVGNRVVRLGHYARTLAEASGAQPGLCDLIMKAAPLHDIGKLGVPAQVLRKAEKLSAPERAQMQRHPEIGAEIIGEHDDPLLKLARTLALTHHERWDGNGYPSGIAGDDIPWPGRVMALVDAFEGMTATQFHREPMTLELAADEIARGSGKQFDPRIVEAFRKCLPAFRKIKETYADSLGDMLDLDFSAAPAPPSETSVPVVVAAATAQRDAAEAIALQRMRESDEARAGMLAGEQARLKVERDLLAAATKDISTQQASRKRAEAAAARDTEAMVLARRRLAEETAAAQAAQERAKAEADAALLAQQAEREKAQALAAAQIRLAAEQALAAATEERRKAEAALAATAATLGSLDSAALETAGRRLEHERQATRLAIARARAEAEAAGLAKNAAQANAQLLADAQMRAEAEQLLAEAAQDKLAAEAAAAQAAEALAAARKQEAATAAKRAADEAASRQAMERRLAAEGEIARAAQEIAASTVGALADSAAIADLTARIGADREAGAASARKASEELLATALARERAERETEALGAARKRLAEDEAATSAANERANAEERAAQLAKEAAQAAAKLIESAEARERAERSLAEAARMRQAAEAAGQVVAPAVASKAPEPHSRRKAFLYALGLIALAAATTLYESEAPPPAPPAAASPALPGFSEGPPLGLRLEVDVGRIVPRERPK